MNETKSNVVKIRIEGASSNVTKVSRDIKSKVQVVDESEAVQTVKRNVVRRYLVALVKRDE